MGLREEMLYSDGLVTKDDRIFRDLQQAIARTEQRIGCRLPGGEMEAVKYDQGKPAFDLLPARALEEVAKVYGFGATKYARRNWEKGLHWCRVYGAILRHAMAWMRGETLDPETGLHHMAHAAFGCLALVEYHFTGAGKDDRKEAEDF